MKIKKCKSKLSKKGKFKKPNNKKKSKLIYNKSKFKSKFLKMLQIKKKITEATFNKAHNPQFSCRVDPCQVKIKYKLNN